MKERDLQWFVDGLVLSTKGFIHYGREVRKHQLVGNISQGPRKGVLIRCPGSTHEQN